MAYPTHEINSLFDSLVICLMIRFHNNCVEIDRLNIIKQFFALNSQYIPHPHFIGARQTQASLIQGQIQSSRFGAQAELTKLLFGDLFCVEILQGASPRIQVILFVCHTISAKYLIHVQDYLQLWPDGVFQLLVVPQKYLVFFFFLGQVTKQICDKSSLRQYLRMHIFDYFAFMLSSNCIRQ